MLPLWCLFFPIFVPGPSDSVNKWVYTLSFHSWLPWLAFSFAVPTNDCDWFALFLGSDVICHVPCDLDLCWIPALLTSWTTLSLFTSQKRICNQFLAPSWPAPWSSQHVNCFRQQQDLINRSLGWRWLLRRDAGHWSVKRSTEATKCTQEKHKHKHTNAHTHAGMASSSMTVTLLRQRTWAPIQHGEKDYKEKTTQRKRTTCNNRSNTVTISTTCSTTTSRVVYFLRSMSTLPCFPSGWLISRFIDCQPWVLPCCLCVCS